MVAMAGLRPVVGVLAMQGAYRDHARALEACGAEPRSIRLAEDLEGTRGLVIPGGESTSMQILLERMELFEALRETVRGGMPTLGTCAGMIMLASRIVDGRAGQRGFGVLDISVRRNGYGRQVDSFESSLAVRGLEGGPFRGIFIRSPLVEDPGSAEVLAEHDGRAVAVRQDGVIGLCFHPELGDDLRLHRHFLAMVEHPRAAPLSVAGGLSQRSSA
jgi:pyridoxal 5'-phosphate synthase pdxT subunit